MRQTTRPAPSPPASGVQRQGKLRGRRWSVALALFLSLLLLLAGSVAFLFKTEAGARLAWRAATAVVSGLSGELQHGTLFNGVALRNVTFQNPGSKMSADRISARWMATVRPPSLTIASIEIGTLDLTPAPATDKPQTPPAQLRLPFALDLQRASIGLLRLHLAGGTESVSAIDLSASSDQVHHQLVLKQAQTVWGPARGTLDVDGSGPVLVEGNAGLAAQIADQEIAVNARIWGPLAQLDVQLSGRGAQLTVDAESVVTPYAPLPFVRARVAIDQLDPHQYAPAAPRARLQVRATLEPEQAPGTGEISLSGPISIRNSLPGPIDKQRIPLDSLQAELLLTTTRQQMRSLQADLPGGGKISGNASWEGKQGRLQLQARQIDLRKLYTPLQSTALNGPVTLDMAGPDQRLEVRLSGKPLSVSARLDLTPQEIVLHEALLQSGPAILRASGKLERGPTAGYTLEGKLTEFDPNRFVDRMQLAATTKAAGAGKRWQIPPGIRVNMDFSAHGRLQPELEAQLDFALHESRYNNMPLTGGGKLAVKGNTVLPSKASLGIAGNQLSLEGSFGRPGDLLRFLVDAPALARLGMGASGRLLARGTAAGSIERPTVDAQWDAQQLRFGELRLDQGAGSVRLDGLPGADKAATFRLAMTGSGARFGTVALASLQASAAGSSADHRLQLALKGTLRGQPLDLQLAAHGALNQAGQGASPGAGTADALAWQGTVDELENRGLPRLALRDKLALKISGNTLELGAARMVLEQASIDLSHLLWRDGLVRSAGRVQSLNAGHLLALQRGLTGQELPVSSDLVFDGSWDVSLEGRASGSLKLVRTGGDLRLKTTRGDNPMEINRLSLDGKFEGDRLQVVAVLDTARLGRLDADGAIGLVQQQQLMTLGRQSTLALRLRAGVARLSNVASIAGPRLALEGRLDADLRAGGTLAAPVLSGEVLAQGLALTLFDQGVRLHDGTARLALTNNMLELQEVLFRGGKGTLRASGRIPLDSSRQDLGANIVAERLQLLADPSRQLTVSGKAVLANRGGQLQVIGNFTVDDALFSLPEKSAPSLGSDVVVIDRLPGPGATPATVAANAATKDSTPVAAPQAPGLLPPRVELELDLGRNFRFRGSGADLRLDGALSIRSGPGQAAQAFGTVRVVDGTYQAFGAKLAIERGVITFQGPFGNPLINIIAMRRQQEVPAGVHVTGTAKRPRIDLISEPDLTEEEKLSWLVFGRGTSSGTGGAGQAQAALQGAALGLLNSAGASRVASELGLNQLKIGSSEYATLAGQPVVTLGKEISNRLYIGYEQSLAGVGGVLKLTYELSRHWSVVLFGGTVAGLDLLYSKRFDRWGAGDKTESRN